MSKNVDVKADLSVKNQSVADPKNAKKQAEGRQPHEDVTEMQTAFIIAGVLGVAGIAAANSGGSSGGATGSSTTDVGATPPNNSVSTTGYFVDAPVQGIQYTTSSGLAGVTGAGGAFTYRPGDEVTFKVGNVSIGSYDTDNIGADGVVMPQDIVGVDRSEIANPVVLAIGRFLQSLDEDGVLDNGITLSEATVSALEEATVAAIDLSQQLPSDVDLLALVQTADATATLVSQVDAINHFMDTLAALDIDLDQTPATVTLTEVSQTEQYLTFSNEEAIVYTLSFDRAAFFDPSDMVITGGELGLIMPSGINTYTLYVPHSSLTGDEVVISIPKESVFTFQGVFGATNDASVTTTVEPFVSSINVDGEMPFVNIDGQENGINLQGYATPGSTVVVNGVTATMDAGTSMWSVSLPGPLTITENPDPLANTNDQFDIEVSVTHNGTTINESLSLNAYLETPAIPSFALRENSGNITDGVTNNSEVVLEGYIGNAEYSLNGGTTWLPVYGNSFDLNPGSNTVLVKITDGLTKNVAISDPVTYVYDSSLVGVELDSPNTVVLAIDETVTYTVTFTEQPASFGIGNIAVSNGEVTTMPALITGASVAPYTYEFQVTPTAETEGRLVVDITGITDLAGNPQEFNSYSLDLQLDNLAPSIVPVFGQNDYEPEFSGAAMDASITLTLSSAIENMVEDPMNGWPLTVKVNGFDVSVSDIIVYDGTTVDVVLDTPLNRSDVVTISGTLMDNVGNSFALLDAPVRNETQFFESVSTPANIVSADFVERDALGDVNYIELSGEGFLQFLDEANGAVTTSDVSSQFDFSRLAYYTNVMDELTATTFSSLDIEKTNIVSDNSIRIYLTESAVNGLIADVSFGAETNGVIVQPEFIGHSTFVLSQAELMAADAAFASMSFTYTLGFEPTSPDAHVKSINLLGTGSYSGNQILVEGADVVAGGTGNITLTDIPSNIGSISSVQMGGGTLTIESWAGDLENKIITGQEGADEGTIIVKALSDSFALSAVVTGIELIGDGITLETDGTLANFTFGNGSQLLKVNEMPVVDGEVSVSGFDALADDIDLTALGAIFANEGLTDRLASTSFKSYAGALEAGNIDADDRILFDSTTGVVSYDADGSGAGSEAVTLFILTGQTVLNNPTAITAEDFRVAVA